MPEPAEERIVHNLIEALEQLRQDLDRVELWTAAWGYFQQPAAEYQPSNRYVLQSAKNGETAHSAADRPKRITRSRANPSG